MIIGLKFQFIIYMVLSNCMCQFEALRTPPTPCTVPGLGSPAFISASLSGSLSSVLKKMSKDLGSLFMVKTGPINQIWINDIDQAMQLYKTEQCSGRSQLKEPVFGEFLFLTRDVESARAIRSRQKSLLSARSSTAAVFEAVSKVALSDIIRQQLNKNDNLRKGVLTWPSNIIAAACFDALIQLYVGNQPLSREESANLLRSVADYRKRGPGLFLKLKNQINTLFGREKKLDQAVEINSLLEEVICRTGASQEIKPLLVSATVGGSEIFPLLLQWCVLRLASATDAQEALHNDLKSLDEEKRQKCFTPLFTSAVSACALDCPVSVAIGPPRKLTDSIDFNDFHLPAEAIVFVMHPGLCRNHDIIDSSGHWPLDLNVKVGDWPMFGGGSRSCPASEQSINFLAAALAELIREWKWEFADPLAATSGRAYQYREDGSLLVPRVSTPLRFFRR